MNGLTGDDTWEGYYSFNLRNSETYDSYPVGFPTDFPQPIFHEDFARFTDAQLVSWGFSRSALAALQF